MRTKQQTLFLGADRSFESYRKSTRRDEFLATMEAIVPWSALREVIEPNYFKVGNGRLPIGWERMLRIHFIQRLLRLELTNTRLRGHEAPFCIDWRHVSDG